MRMNEVCSSLSLFFVRKMVIRMGRAAMKRRRKTEKDVASFSVVVISEF